MADLKELFSELLNKTDTERQAYYDTGFFNGITSAYMYRAMKDADIPQDKINDALFNLKILHDTTSASQILEEYRNKG